MFKGKIAEIIANAVARKQNMFEAGQKSDKEMDKALGKVSSEKIQRGVLTSMLLDFLKGLWHESPDKLGDFLISEGNKMKVKV